MRISHSEFCKAIYALQEQYDHDQKCAEAAKTIYPDGEVLLYDNHKLTNAMVMLLQHLTNDLNKCKYGYTWTEYFCYELDFGRKYEEGMVKDAEGNTIPLHTPAQLYRLLQSNQEE